MDETTRRTAMEIRMLFGFLAKLAARSLEGRLCAHHPGLTALQYGIMQALNHHRWTISEMSRQFMLDPSTLVPAVDALERKGLIERGRDPADRRRVPLSLTPAGESLLREVSPMDESDPLVQSLTKMEPEQREQLLSLLRTLARHMPDGEKVLERVQSRIEHALGKDGGCSCEE